MKKKIQRGIALALVGMALVGCGEKYAQTGNATIDSMTVDQLGEALLRALEERSSYKTKVESQGEIIEDLSEKVKGVQEVDPEFPAVAELEDGRVVFNKPGDKVRLPEVLSIPGDSPVTPENLISMGSGRRLTLEMDQSWTYRVEGNKLYVVNSGGVYGVISLGTMAGMDTLELIDTLFDGNEARPEIVNKSTGLVVAEAVPASDGLIVGIPPQPGAPGGKDALISWNNKVVGRQVLMHTAVEDSPATLRAGAYVVQGTSVVYVFMYETAMEDISEMSIRTLIGQMLIQNKPIKVTF